VQPLRVAEFTFEVSSVVPAHPDQVWARVSTIEGVNDELMPLARMTLPRQYAGMRLDPAIVPLGERAFRSWILLFGVVPIDFDDLTLLRIEPGRGFLERSPMLSQRVWVHERSLEPVDGGCRVTDRIRFEPRLPVLGPVLLPVFRFFFHHRHRRLGRFFGARER
jgi:ligand-binding SRPBCC domain-containing protein